MFAALAQLPVVAIVAIFALYFSAVTFLTRYLVRRHTSPERQEELITLADVMTGPVGVSMAFLIGFSVTITWGTISAAQSAVEKVAASAQEVAWLTENLDDKEAAADIGQTLRKYLETVQSQDVDRLAARDLREMPSFTYIDALQGQLHNLSRDGSGDGADASRGLDAAAAVAENQAELISIARRQLPDALLWLLLVAGTLSSMVMGITAAKVDGPFLLIGWALVSAIGISVVLIMYDPFSGDIAVDMQALDDAAHRILTP